MTCKQPLFYVLILFLISVFPVAAQGPIVLPPPDVMIEPFPRIETIGLELITERIEVTIEDQVATTRVAQTFRNPSEWALEGEYLFPLPPDAAIQDMDMTVDGEKLEGQLMDVEQAREIYEEIVRQRLDPALLEWVGNGLFRTRIFPIPPGETRLIELEYTQLLTAENGLFGYRFPLRQASAGSLFMDDESGVSRKSERTDVSVAITLESEVPLRAIYSPSHEVDIIRDGERSAIIGWEGSEVELDRDFSLFWSVSPEEIELSLLSFKERGEDGFFLLLAAPTIEPPDEQVIARDVVLVLDTSGSMEGGKMEQAKSALDYVLDNLNSQDRFNVIAFSTGTRRFASALQPVSEVAAARRWVEELEPGGSTDISRALLEALNMGDESERPMLLMFLTDGLPTAGIVEPESILNAALQDAPEGVRTFTFGVGYDVDTILLDSLAAEMRGASGYVTPDERIDEEVSAFYAKVSAPVLSDVQLDWGDALVEEIYPAPLPDLFAGQQLVMAGRYRDAGPVSLTLEGDVNGQTQRFTYDDLRLSDDGESNEGWLPRLWATRKIGTLLQNIRRYGENREAVEELIDLAIRYGIVTPYTTFLVEEDQDLFNQASRDTLADEAPSSFAAAASGEEAVEEAEAAMDLASSERAVSLPARANSDDEANSAPTLRTVGAKTFAFRDERWVDTRYNESQELIEIPFGGPAYFDLSTQSAEMGRYLSVGVPLIIVVEETAYLIIENSDLPAANATQIVIPTAPATTEGTVVAIPTQTNQLEVTVVASATPTVQHNNTDIATPTIESEATVVSVSTATNENNESLATPKLITAASTPEASPSPEAKATATAELQPIATTTSDEREPTGFPLAGFAAILGGGVVLAIGWAMRGRG